MTDLPNRKHSICPGGYISPGRNEMLSEYLEIHGDTGLDVYDLTALESETLRVHAQDFCSVAKKVFFQRLTCYHDSIAGQESLP